MLARGRVVKLHWQGYLTTQLRLLAERQLAHHQAAKAVQRLQKMIMARAMSMRDQRVATVGRSVL